MGFPVREFDAGYHEKKLFSGIINTYTMKRQ
jgi:hypothetical protein